MQPSILADLRPSRILLALVIAMAVCACFSVCYSLLIFDCPRPWLIALTMISGILLARQIWYWWRAQRILRIVVSSDGLCLLHVWCAPAWSPAQVCTLGPASLFWSHLAALEFVREDGSKLSFLLLPDSAPATVRRDLRRALISLQQFQQKESRKVMKSGNFPE
ncbi:hypothetical protein [Undibacterium curvum]|uniref:Toxin CptA n=1 Tax=Undibacterium curvum TaxID=2762294 RepID=A0ABR7A1B2_9BURK|nr:hypothetical protein [Undibacterium curvum]MBC3930531.1 hypothetical protein [Undibacterium curvum]